jgi:phosphoribosyl 1,2-cyclic phosphodiesterase
MRLKVLGSSSAGNCYILENDKEALIIECGVRIEKIKQALKFNLSKVAGCLVSHEHLDHCKSVVDIIKSGINVYTTSGTYKGMNFETNHHRAKIIDPGHQFTVGSFKVIPFDVKHDAQKPVGFLINHDETGTVLFVTDTYYVETRFRGLNNIIVECNYSQEILDSKLAAGATPDFLRNRIFKSHMNLNTCKDLLRANDLSGVNNIVLIHLSDSNSNARQFKEEVTRCTGKVVHVAEPGLVIENFNKKPF